MCARQAAWAPLLTLLLALVPTACSLWQDGGELPSPDPVPPWVGAAPRDEGDRWVAVGTGVGERLDLALARAREDAVWQLLRAARGAVPGDGMPDVPGLIVLSERRFVQRLEGSRLRATIEVAAPELSLRPEARRAELLAAAAPDQRLAVLGSLARELLLLGLDEQALATLELAEAEPATNPQDLLPVAALQRLLGDTPRAVAVNARAQALLAGRPADAPERLAAALQGERLAAGIVPLADSLLALERLTMRHADPAVLAVPVSELRCNGTEIAPLTVELPTESGVLVPFLVSPTRVSVERLSDEGRVRRRSLALMLGLPTSCAEATLMLWLVPDGAPVLSLVGQLSREPLLREAGQVDDDDRRLLQQILAGLELAASRGGVAAARVQLHR